MTAGISSIALFAPVVASNAVFSARRASRGIDSASENPVYAAMNMDIAAGQVLKGSRAVKALDIAANGVNNSVTHSASEGIKNLSQANKFVNGASKVINFTADNINPVICLTSGIKVLGSDDKVDTAARESLALTTMFAAEAGAKKLLGMPITKKIDGKNVTFTRAGLYEKNPFLKRKVEEFCKYCNKTRLFNNKISLKYLPGATKGLGFVTTSILGYKAGVAGGNVLLGEPAVKNPSNDVTAP